MVDCFFALVTLLAGGTGDLCDAVQMFIQWCMPCAELEEQRGVSPLMWRSALMGLSRQCRGDVDSVASPSL
jgi:hypothetical protein